MLKFYSISDYGEFLIHAHCMMYWLHLHRGNSEYGLSFQKHPQWIHLLLPCLDVYRISLFAHTDHK